MSDHDKEEWSKEDSEILFKIVQNIQVLKAQHQLIVIEGGYTLYGLTVSHQPKNKKFKSSTFIIKLVDLFVV